MVMMFIEATVALVGPGIRTRSSEECHLIFTLLGTMLGMAACLATVWLNNSSYEIFFLLVGWSQAVRGLEARDMERVELRLETQPMASSDMHVYT
jgi:hypothetical protein